jgi:hypothetical protein
MAAPQPILNPDEETFFKQARKAIVPHVTAHGMMLVIAREGVPGHTPSPLCASLGYSGMFKTWDEAQAVADRMNRELLGWTDLKEAYKVIASSMRASNLGRQEGQNDD